MSNLPQYHSSHKQENTSLKKLRSILPDELFILRSEDGGDYGVDRILEVIKEGKVTNVRSHIQIKSKKQNSAKSGTIKFPVPIKSINYLLNSVNSLFLVYSFSEEIFFWEWTRQIAITANNKNIKIENTEQKTINYHFKHRLTSSGFKKIHEKLILDNDLLRKIEIDGRPIEKSIVNSIQSGGTYRELVILYLQGKFETVIGFVKDNTVDNPSINALVSWCYYQIHNYHEALRFITKAQHQDSSNSQIRKMKAAILCEKGVVELNKEVLELAKNTILMVDFDTWTWEDYYNYGNILSGLREYADALIHYRTALRLKSNEPIIWKNMGGCYYYLQDHEKEMECLNKALELDENLIEALVSKANTLGNIFGEYNQAIELLTKALQISDVTYLNNRDIYYWLAMFYRDLGDPEMALKVINDGQQIHPGNRLLENLRLSVLVKFWRKNNDIKNQAIQLLKKLISEFPKDYSLRMELLKIYQEQGQVNEADQFLQETFQGLGFNLSPLFLSKFEFKELIKLLSRMGEYIEFRRSNNMGGDFFSCFEVKIETFQKIEFGIAIHFAKLGDIITPNRSQDELFLAIESYIKDFISINEFCSELIIEKYKNKSVEKHSEIMTQMIMTLPEILLAELSRQIGWLLARNGYEVKMSDRLIKNSEFLNQWFEFSIEPVLKGAHNILNWSEKDVL